MEGRIWNSLKRKYFISARHGRKLQNCRWNFDAISCHSPRYKSISGLGGHIAISGCRSLLLSYGDTFFDVAVVGKLDFITWITTILILDLFCHISQHDHKISPVSKNSHVFDVMSPIGNLIVAFCTYLIYRKSHKRTAPKAEQNFFSDSETELGAFLPPSAIRGLILIPAFQYVYTKLSSSFMLVCVYR